MTRLLVLLALWCSHMSGISPIVKLWCGGRLNRSDCMRGVLPPVWDYRNPNWSVLLLRMRLRV